MNYPYPHIAPLADALGLRSRTLGADWGVPTWVLSEVSHGGVYLCDDEQDNGTGDVVVRVYNDDGNDLSIVLASGSPDDLFDTISDYLTEDQISSYLAHLKDPTGIVQEAVKAYSRLFSTEDNDCGRCGADWRNCTCDDDDDDDNV